MSTVSLDIYLYIYIYRDIHVFDDMFHVYDVPGNLDWFGDIRYQYRGQSNGKIYVHHILGDPSMFTAELYQLLSPCDFCMIDGGQVHP